jgi:hypothetical protein
MAITHAAEDIKSDMPDTREQPLDEPVYLDSFVLERLTGRKGLAEGGAETSVSAFNSSI